MATADATMPPRRIPRTTVFLLLGFVAGLAAVLYWIAPQIRERGLASRKESPLDRPDQSLVIPPIYQKDRAMGYLQKLCDFGPRPAGSEAMVAQQDYLETFFTERGGDVRRQTFPVRHPQTGERIEITNLIATFAADAPVRYLVCAHYDTRPYADNDPRDRRGRFVGANDGASGTAALMEWSHRFADLPEGIGIDVVLFDAEELIYSSQDSYFLGSTHFAQQHKADPQTQYAGGILLDMVGDKYLQLFYERNSLRYAGRLTRDIWFTAEGLGARAFVPRVRHEIQDDHLPLNRIAKIPTVDLIDFDYPRPGAPTLWHTTGDVPARCSGHSLATVVYVLDTWLHQSAP